MADSQLSNAVIRRQVTNVSFGMYSDEEVRSRSVMEITSPIAFDELGTPLPYGLYDPLLGPTDSKNTSSCPTCGNVYQNCPGHSGHIELCVPVYQPLIFSKMLSLLRVKCLACHRFRLGEREGRIFCVKLHLVDCGRVKEALELDAAISAIQRGVEREVEEESEDANSSSFTIRTTKEKEELKAKAHSSIDQFLADKLQNTSPPEKLLSTSHERAVRRQFIKEFISASSKCLSCKNCGAHSPKIRQDASNKVFQTTLSGKAKRANFGLRIKIRPAASIKMSDGMNATDIQDNISGWDSDDSDMEDDDNYDSDGEAQGESTLSDDEIDVEDENELLGRKSRQSKVNASSATNSAQQAEADKVAKPDKFMHALEIEAQVRLTWTMEPTLCAKVFGNAHSESDIQKGDVGGWDIFFMRAIPVPPSRFRPPMVMGIMTVEHAQNHYLNKIMELNDRLRTMFASAENDGNNNNKEDGDKRQLDPEQIQARALSVWIELQTTINCLIDSSKDPSAAAAQNVPNGIRQLLEKKEGIFRKHMMGKRVNYACRSVISPDPYIGTNEIGLPLYFAETLTYPTPVTPLNVAEMRELVLRGPNNYPGARWVELPNGRRLELGRMQQEKREAIAARLLSSNGLTTVGRQMRNGDMVIMNRQPSLHKPSMMAHAVRVLHSPTQKTIRMHYANCNTYNADYDGDEMNCHFPQNDIARAEAEVIAKTDLQYIVPTDGSPLRGLIQDHVDAGVKMTSKDTFFDKWEYQQLLFSCLSSLTGLELIQADADIEMLPPAIIKPRELWTGKQVISTLLHHLRKGKDGDPTSTEILPGISVERKAKTPDVAFGEDSKEHLVIVRDGELIRGVLDKAAFGSTDFSLVHGVYEAYGPTKAGLLLNAFGRLFTAYLQYFSGHSCRMEDLILTPEADQKRRELVKTTYNKGSRAAKAWADSDGGKVDIPPLIEQPNFDKKLMPVEAAATAAKISELLTGEEGANNAASLDAYMQSQLNPLASEIMKVCLPDGLAVPFPANTFALMVTTGAKGSTVNQSQVSSGLGQQALEGRRVPRMSSGKTMPSFAPYDPNPRADGFIADRFLTGVRPQEYYFHCMAGREGLVDTAVKTSRSGYLQRCLVKHLEELKVCYDHTVRDGEGGVVQFLYGEDGIDPMKAAHLDGSQSTLEYMARNHEALEHRYPALPRNSLDIAIADHKRSEMLKEGSTTNLLEKGSFVQARKLRFGNAWRRGTLCRGWYSAFITKVHGDELFDLKYVDDGSTATNVPLKVEFDYAGAKNTAAMSRTCTLIKPGVPEPIISDFSKNRGSHLIGNSGSCVSEKVASDAIDLISNNEGVQIAMKSAGVSKHRFKKVIGAKFSSALCAPGEAVGCIAAQSIGEPSTQMTLNTFHLAGAGANVTLGIPRLREIIMTASKTLKTPTMSVPLLPSVSDKRALKLTRFFTRLTLMELISSHGGISVRESLQQSASGSWDRAYHVTLKLHSAERISEAFGLSLEDVATVVSQGFMKTLSKIMNQELDKANDSKSFRVSGAEASDFVSSGKPSKSKAQRSNDHDDSDNDSDDDSDDGGDVEDGVNASRFSHKKEMTSYGDMDEEEKEMTSKEGNTTRAVTDDEESDEEEIKDNYWDKDVFSAVRVHHKSNSLVLRPLCVDPSSRPLLMVGLVEKAANKTLVRFRPGIDLAFVNEEKGRGRCLQTAGCNFEEFWNLDEVKHNELSSNDIWAVRCAYGVEAARMSIVDQIRSVFGAYGIEVDPRHLTLIADYMTFDGGYKAMNRGGMADAGSAFLQMSFETTANFMVEAALNNRDDHMASPSANIVMGTPIKHGTGAFECIVQS